MAISAPIKKWLASFFALCLALGIVAYFNASYAKGIIWGFFKGEFAILYLMTHTGLGQREAVLVSIACSTLGIYNFFWWGEPIGKLITQLLVWLNGRLGISSCQTPEQQVKAVGPENSFRRFAKKFPYCVLPAYCFVPFVGVPFGVIFAKSFRLNTKIAFAMMCAGNVAEKIMWGYLAYALKPFIENFVAPILYLSLGIAATYAIMRFFYSGRRQLHPSINSP